MLSEKEQAELGAAFAKAMSSFGLKRYPTAKEVRDKFGDRMNWWLGDDSPEPPEGDNEDE